MLGLHRDQLNAVLIHRGADVGLDGAGQLAVPAADHLGLGQAADHVLHRVVHVGADTAFRHRHLAVQALDELLGIADPPQHKAVGHHGLFVLGDDVRDGQVIQQGGLGQGAHRLHQRQLETHTRLGADAHHPAKLPDHAVFVLLGHHHGAARQDQHQHNDQTNHDFLGRLHVTALLPRCSRSRCCRSDPSGSGYCRCRPE